MDKDNWDGDKKTGLMAEEKSRTNPAKLFSLTATIPQKQGKNREQRLWWQVKTQVTYQRSMKKKGRERGDIPKTNWKKKPEMSPRYEKSSDRYEA